MTARPGAGTPGGVVSATDHRRTLGAFMAPGSATDPLVTRSGIVPAPGNPLQVAQNSPLGMSALVQPGNAQIHRVGRGPYTPYNDAVATVSFDAAPASNSRWDLVYLAQNDSEADGNSLTPLGVLKGTATPSPDKPYGLLPAGGIVLAEVGPIAVGTTQITNAMITNVARYTAVRGAPLLVRNQAERDELTPLASTTFPITVERLDTGLVERNRGAGWDVVTNTTGWTPYAPTFGNFVAGLSIVAARYMKIGKTVHYSGLVTLGTGFGMNSSPLAIGLPFPLGGTFNNILNSLGTSMLNDNGSGTYMAMLTPSTGTALMIRAYNGGAVTISSPFAWAVGDSFSWNVTYETSA